MVRGGRARAWPSLALVGLLLLAACSSDGDEGPSTPTATSAPATSEGPTEGPSKSTGSPSPGPSEETKDLTSTRFQTPSGNIVCESSTDSLLCAIGSGLVPEPSEDFCPLDWIGVFIQTGEFAGPSCSGDPGVSGKPAKELEYEHTWSLNGVDCRSERSGLTCQDQSGNGFTLAMAGWSLLGKEDAAAAAFPELRRMARMQARRKSPGQIATVPLPALGSGRGCGELQEAFVQVELTDGSSEVYAACFVSGTWAIL